MGDTTVNALSDIMRSDHFDTEIFTNIFKHATDGKDVAHRSKRDSGLKLISKVHFPKKDWTIQRICTLVQTKRVKDLQERTTLVSLEKELMFRPVDEFSAHCVWNIHAITGPYIHNVYCAVIQDIMKDSSQFLYCTDDTGGPESSFKVFVQIHFTKFSTPREAPLSSSISHMPFSLSATYCTEDSSSKPSLFISLATNTF